MRYINVIIALLIAVSNVFAAIPKSAADGLKDVRKRYKAIKTFRCDFTEQFRWQFTGEAISREGTIVTDNDDRFRMETREQIIVSDGTDVYRYNILKNQVMIERVQAASKLLPRQILLDFGSEFNAVSISPVPVSGTEGYRLELVPTDAEESLVSRASVWITTKDNLVHKMEMDDLNGNRTTYILQNIILDKPVDQRETTFEIPESAELFDLRQ